MPEVELRRLLAVEDAFSEPREVTLTADADERGALARRFKLRDIKSLDAHITTNPVGAHDIVVRGRLFATVVQACVVTLANVEKEVEETFEIRFSKDADPAAEDDAANDAYGELAEPISGENIDLGEIVAQHLALGLDPYPRAPGARFEEAGDRPEARSPFAKLKDLKQSD